MRNDLYIGALVALGAHAALALVNPAVKPPLLSVKDDGFIEVVYRPPVEPPEPPPTPEVGDTSEVKEPTVAAPRLPDVPRVAPNESFTMPPTVVPEGAEIDPRAVTIPAVRTATPGRVGEIYDPSALERAPLARFQAQPHYPFEMRRDGIAGEVLVEFVVDANGAVREARAVRSSQREFEAAAVQAVSKWTFRPGQKGGRNVATRMQVPIVFSLNAERD
jgi:protein TonB